MGWAKYSEDNYDIYVDRQYMRGGWNKDDSKNHARKDSFFFEEISLSIHQTSEYRSVDDGNHTEDKYLVCRECGRRFVFSVSNQNDYASNGWKQPKRCKACRRKKWAA